MLVWESYIELSHKIRHSLIFFVEKLSMQMSNSSYEFIYTVNKISVPTRYPEDLRKLFEAYTKKRTEEILNQQALHSMPS